MPEKPPRLTNDERCHMSKENGEANVGELLPSRADETRLANSGGSGYDLKEVDRRGASTSARHLGRRHGEANARNACALRAYGQPTLPTCSEGGQRRAVPPSGATGPSRHRVMSRCQRKKGGYSPLFVLVHEDGERGPWKSCPGMRPWDGFVAGPRRTDAAFVVLTCLR